MSSTPAASAAIPRLAVMMFLQFFVWGSWYVTAPSYLGKIGFTGDDFGWTYAVGPIAGILSPLLVGMVADRFFPTQRVLAVLHLLGTGAMYYATVLMGADDPSPDTINIVFFGYMLCYYPTLALTNALAMRNIADTEKQFPIVRVFGTLGWIAAGVALTVFGFGASIEMFQLATIASLLLGVYSLTLPNTPPAAGGETSIGKLLGLDALVMLKDRNYAVFMLCSFLICIPLAFYYQLAERTLQTAGVEDTPLKMTFGQISEVVFMALMPLFFRRLGVKWMLAVGMFAWVVRYGLFAAGTPDDVVWMVLGGVVLHGICYDFFFVTGQIYTDKHAPAEIRGQAQGMLVLFTLGLGMFFGAKVAGEVEVANTPPAAQAFLDEAKPKEAEITRLAIAIDAADESEREELTARKEQLGEESNALKLQAYELMDWGTIWKIPAFGAGGVLLLFLLLFRRREAEEA